MPFGSEAVRLARASVESEVRGTPLSFVPEDGRFMEPSGVFVTLSTYPSHDLRGCIGFPMPYYQAGRAIEESARAACHDPRFPDLRERELDHITVEVTVLTVPEGCVEMVADSAFVYSLDSAASKGGKQVFSRIPVTVGLSDGINIEITGDISPEMKLRGMLKEAM